MVSRTRFRWSSGAYTAAQQPRYRTGWPVVPATFNPAAAPELIATGSLWDDFDIDEKAGAAYITTHRQNTLQRVPLDPHSGQAIQTVAGQPFDPQIVGPSDFAWGPGPHDSGAVAYITTDGGVAAYDPPPAAEPRCEPGQQPVAMRMSPDFSSETRKLP